jgi:hypothetical protein
MSLQQELFNNLVIAASSTAYSQAVDLAGNTNVAVGLTVVVGGTVIASATLEQSTDLSNWSTLSTTWSPAIAVAPSFTLGVVSGTSLPVGARYVRLKITTGAGAVCVNASLTASGA